MSFGTLLTQVERTVGSGQQPYRRVAVSAWKMHAREKDRTVVDTARVDPSIALSGDHPAGMSKGTTGSDDDGDGKTGKGSEDDHEERCVSPRSHGVLVEFRTQVTLDDAWTRASIVVDSD